MRDWTGYQLILPSIPDKGIRGPSRVQHLPPFVMRHMRGLGFLQTSAICIIWRMDGKWQYPFTRFLSCRVPGPSKVLELGREVALNTILNLNLSETRHRLLCD